MNSLIHADIFFLVSTIAVIVFIIGTAITFAYVIKILRNVSNISETAENESRLIKEDIHIIRSQWRIRGFDPVAIYNFLRRTFIRWRQLGQNE